jgi:hypothetical protein
MRTMTLWSATSILGFLLSAPVAQAIPRTFVSGTGSGTSCTRTTPCATFQAAHDATDAGGEINCVDAGEFGAVTITKSITIDCTGAVGTVATTTPSISINAAGAVVRLRGLDIHGAGGSNAGPGIAFHAGAALFVEDCSVTDMTHGVSGYGLSFAPTTAANLFVSNSTMSNNFVGGITVDSAFAPGPIRVMLDRVRLEKNGFDGLDAIAGPTTVSVQMRDSVAAGNARAGVHAETLGNVPASVTVDRSASILNKQYGILASTSLAFVLVGRSTVMSNLNGLAESTADLPGGPTGQIFSYQNNHLTGNASDGAGTGILALK